MVFGMASISLGGWLMASDEAFLRRTSMQVWQAIGLQMQPYKGGRSPSQGGPTKPSTTYPPNYTLDQRVQRYGTGEARPQQFVQTPTNYFFVPSIPPEPGFRRNRCLLYTSPSPRDYAASRMPSSA